MQIANSHGQGFLPKEKQALSDLVTPSHPVTTAILTEKPISPDAMSVCASEKWIDGSEMRICASEKWIDGSEMKIYASEK